MRKITSLLMLLFLFAGMAHADFTQPYSSSAEHWTAVGEQTLAEGLQTIVTEHNCAGTLHYGSNEVNVSEAGTITVTVDYTGGSHMIAVLGVEFINADGDVAYSDYHYGTSGGVDNNNVYTLNDVAAGNYTVKYYVCSKAGDHDLTQTNGNVIFTGNITNAAAEDPTYPFTITTDANSPYLYAIRSGRGDAYWYTYDETDGKISLSAYTAEDNQLWYFMEVDVNGVKVLRLFPYAGEGKAISYSDTNDGQAKVSAQDVNAEGYTSYWHFVSTNGEAPYGLQTYGYENYLSNWGGETYKMGFWNSAPSSDGGTAMYFADPSEPLQNLIDQAKALQAGEGVGYYTNESIAELNTAITTAESNLANNKFTTADLQAAINALKIVMPDPDKYYTIQNAKTGAYMCEGNGGGLIVENGVGIGEIFQFKSTGEEGKFYLLNVERGTYLSTAPTHAAGQVYATASKTSEAKVVTIAPFYLENRVSITPEGGATLHHDTNYSTIVGWNDNAESKSAWKITEIDMTAETAPAHRLAITSAGWASLILGYDAEIPEGVQAYYITKDPEGGRVQLTTVEGNVIPACNAVLVSGAVNTYSFKLATETATNLENNKLKGTLINQNITGSAYVLGVIDGETGLYKAELNQDNGSAFLNNAFKAYLPIAENATETSETLSFSFGETTGIGSAIIGENGKTEIFDLSGRRVAKMQKGIYIVNGKKVLVK